MDKKIVSVENEDSEDYPGKELIHLDNDTTHPMVSRFRTKAYWTYLCYPCGATCLGESFLRSHLHGKKHNTHILSRRVWPAQIIKNHPYFFREENKSVKPFSESGPENIRITVSVTDDVVIAPGEPVPPGVEETVHMKSILENSLKSVDFPVVGLEYIVEILEEDSTASYYCTLCSVQGFPNIILKHIDSHRHKMKYMSINYPKCYNLLRKYSGLEKYHPGNVQVLHNICQCIDQAYGRLPPFIIEREEFERNKTMYLKKVYETKHITEKDGGNFEELVDEEYILMVSQTHKNTLKDDSTTTKKNSSPTESYHRSKPSSDDRDNKRPSNSERRVQRSLRKKRPSVDSISSLSIVSDDDLDNDCIIVSSKPYNRNSSEDKHSQPERRNNFQKSTDSKFYDRSRSPIRNRSPVRNKSPFSRDRKDNKHQHVVSRPNQDNDKEKWDMYRRRFNKCIEIAKKAFEFNEQFPEKHPCYQTEWKKYWNKKYKEFQGDKKDIWQCDMKPEWITFWSKKMRELHEEELAQKKEEILKDLGLPLDNAQDDNTSSSANSKKMQDPNFVEKELKMLRNRSLRSREPSKERDSRSVDSRSRGERNFRGRSRERNFERVRPMEKGKERERSKRSRNKSWDRNDNDYKRDGRKYERERDNKIRKLSPSCDTFSSKNYSSSSRYISEQMSKVEKERKGVKWSIYHSKMKIFKDKLMREYDAYEENPKSHPMYHNEWLKFRSKNPTVNDDSNFAMNSEWNKFWKQKVKSLYDITLNEKMDNLLNELDLNRESPTGIIQERKYDRERVSDSPDFHVHKSTTKVEELNEDLNPVVVLRHLTALENYLGSLGPKVIDLLAAVLKMEKDKPNSSEDILTNEVYLVLLETVKEKLKGQLLANLIDSHVIQATKTAIQYTASLLHQASVKAEEEKKKQSQQSLSIAGVGPIEKAAIANQIAEVLITQGKTDVTTEELEKLINAVVGMANASQTSASSTVTTTSLLSQLMEIQNPTNTNIEKQSSINGLQALQTAYNNNNKNVPRSESPVQDSNFNDKLSDSDLKTLFQNYKDLSVDEQNGLMTYIRRLEMKDSERVKNLQKYIDFAIKCQAAKLSSIESRRSPSPFANRIHGMNPSLDDKSENDVKETIKNKPFIIKSKDSDDDEDYSYEDVIKSAAEKAKEKQLQEELEIIKQSLKDNSNDTTDKPEETPPIETVQVESKFETSNVDFDIESLAHVLELVKNATSLNNTPNPLKNLLGNQSQNIMRSQPQNIMGSQPQNIMGNQPQNIMGNQSHNMMGNQAQNIMGNQPQNIMGNQPQNIMRNQSQNIMGNQPQNIMGNQLQNMMGNQPQNIMGNQIFTQSDQQQVQRNNQSIRQLDNMNVLHREPDISPRIPSLFDNMRPGSILQNINAQRNIRENLPRLPQGNQYQTNNNFQSNQFPSSNQFHSANKFQPPNQFQSPGQLLSRSQFQPENHKTMGSQLQLGSQRQIGKQFQSGSREFQSGNQLQSSLNDMPRSMLPPSSGLGRMNQDAYNQNSSKMDSSLIQNTNISSQQFHNDRLPGSNFQNNTNMQSNFDNQNKYYGNQMSSSSSFNRGADHGNRFSSNDPGFNNAQKMGWNNNSQNQYDSRTSMDNLGPSASEYNQYGAQRGNKGNVRNDFSSRGRGTGRSFDNSFRRGGSGGGMNY